MMMKRVVTWITLSLVLWFDLMGKGCCRDNGNERIDNMRAGNPNIVVVPKQLRLDTAANAAASDGTDVVNCSLWKKEAVLVASDAAENGNSFGASISINQAGDLLAVGDNAANVLDSDSNEGKVYLFQFAGSNWTEMESNFTSSDSTSTGLFGDWVRLNGAGDVIAIGAPFADVLEPFDQLGKIHVLRLTGSTWKEEGILTKNNSKSDGGYFGGSFAMNAAGNVIVVANQFGDAFKSGDSLGTAIVFRYLDSKWKTEAILKVEQPDTGDMFTDDVAVNGDGDLIAVGALSPGDQGDSMEGKIYLFRYHNFQWKQEAIIKPREAETDGGSSIWKIGMNSAGDVLVVGNDRADALDNDDKKGKLLIFRYLDSKWIEEKSLIASDADKSGSSFGFPAINSMGDVIAVADPDAMVMGEDGGKGKVYVFRYRDFDWKEEAILTVGSIGSTKSYSFGHRVDINGDGDVIIVSDDSADVFENYDRKGKVYIFRNTCSV